MNTKEQKQNLKEITVRRDAIPPGEPITVILNDNEIQYQFVTNDMIFNVIYTEY